MLSYWDNPAHLNCHINNVQVYPNQNEYDGPNNIACNCNNFSSIKFHKHKQAYCLSFV